MLVFALRAAKDSTGAAGDKSLRTVSANPKRPLIVRQHEAEHHLNPQQQGMEIPYDRRLLQQGYMIGWCDPVKGRHGLPIQVPGIFIKKIIIIIVQVAGGQREYLVNKLLLHPVIPFGVLPLKAHIDCHWLV